MRAEIPAERIFVQFVNASAHFGGQFGRAALVDVTAGAWLSADDAHG